MKGDRIQKQKTSAGNISLRSSSRRIDAVVAGYLCVDIAPGFPPGRASIPASELFRPGRLIETRHLDISLGGVVANTGLALKKFGQRVELMGSVGCDSLGDIVTAQLREHGVAGGIRRNRRAGTAYGIVLAPPGLDRIFLDDPGCNEVFASRDIDYRTVARSRLFHLGYPTLMKSLWIDGGRELKKILRNVRKLGVAVSLDMALPDSESPAGKADWPGILANILPHVDIFVPSIEETLFMLDRARYARILSGAGGRDMVDAVPRSLYKTLADRVLAMGVKVLMIKAGHRGAYIKTGDVQSLNASTPVRLSADNWNNRDMWVPTFPVVAGRVKNACGAGDCAVAGFLAAILKGMNIESAAMYAMLAGRDNLYGVDAISGLSNWKAMTVLVERELHADRSFKSRRE
jgi:sugar/nucleoside kinase (ribokinase family)